MLQDNVKKKPQSIRQRMDGEFDDAQVVTALEGHLRLLADHQGIGMPCWYYW